jgi:hypothetical protein
MVGAVASEWVFAYGSLVVDQRPVRLAWLRDYRRGWGVAMDNSEDVPGYKYYVEDDRGRPAVWVVFLDLVRVPGASVNGILSPVDDDELARLDRRERNYDRVDVTASIDAPPGRTWAYVGSAVGRRRRADGERAGAAVIQRAYLDKVRAGFAALGPDELARFEASTDAPACPVVELTRVELPPQAAR